MRLLAAFALGVLACGGTTTNGDGGVDGGNDVTDLDVITTGCSQFSTSTFAVDASACVPQLASATSCNGQVCTWKVEVPCTGDAGSDAGDAGDGGAPDCNAWCNAVAPPNVTNSGFCQPYAEDGGGMFASCGGCGI